VHSIDPPAPPSPLESIRFSGGRKKHRQNTKQTEFYETGLSSPESGYLACAEILLVRSIQAEVTRSALLVAQASFDRCSRVGKNAQLITSTLPGLMHAHYWHKVLFVHPNNNSPL
jgi:hypothetical protein